MLPRESLVTAVATLAANRRVQLVVSGNAIGVQEQAPSTSGGQAMSQPAPAPQPAQTSPAQTNATGVSNVPQQ